MIILASDTSTGHGSVAVKNAAGKVFLVEMDPARPHSETLLPAVSEVLSIAGLERRDVQALAVGIGPGAFTGLRVGLATFKGWASAAHLPVFAVSSLDAVAFPVLSENRGAIVVADARKGEAYVCYYPSLDEHGLPVRRGIPELVSLGDIPVWLNSIDDRNAVILGTGVGLLDPAETGKWASFIEDRPCYPSAYQILAIGEILMHTGRTGGPSSLIPDYVRPPDAKPQERGFRSEDP